MYYLYTVAGVNKLLKKENNWGGKHGKMAKDRTVNEGRGLNNINN